MNNDLKQTDLDDEQISKIRYILARKANIWYMTRGLESDGMEVFRTQDENLFLLRDIETGVELGMRKEESCGGAVTKLTFVLLKSSSDEKS